MDSVSIHLTEIGFQLREDEKVLVQVQWHEICEAVAFKKDLVTTDLICVACRLTNESGEDPAAVVHEEMPGFAEWMTVLPTKLPGLKRDWYTKVMLPPFKASLQQIWKREE